jgi:integrase
MAKRGRRANGEGTVFWRESRQRYEAELRAGSVRKVFTGKTRKAVIDKLTAAQAALEQGLDTPDNRTTISAFTGWWMREVLPGEGLAPATVRNYVDVLDTYVLPLVGQRTLTGPKALTPHDVEAMTSALGKRGLSPRVQLAARTVLGKVLRAAEQRGLVSRNVARLAKRPGDSGAARKVKALRPAEVAKLLSALEGTPWHPVAVLGVTTGLRPGELLALHWQDVHLKEKEPHLSVRLAISHVGGATLKAPKRHRSYRTVPLTPEAVATLREWGAQQTQQREAAGELWDPSWPGLVFTAPDGQPWRVDSLRHALGRAVVAHNRAALSAWMAEGSQGPKPTPLPHTHPHALRHTYATHLLEAGVPIHHVAELLGDTVAVVESTYSHVLRPKHEVTALVSGVLG